MCLVIIPLLLLPLSNPTFAASATTSPPAKGGILPVINLQVPKDPAEKMYLGSLAADFSEYLRLGLRQ